MDWQQSGEKEKLSEASCVEAWKDATDCAYKEQKGTLVESMLGERMKKEENHAYVSFDAKSVNESFARMVVMAFMTDMNPTLDELEDVKTAVSEAVTNAIIHGYDAESDETEGDLKQLEGQIEGAKEQIEEQEEQIQAIEGQRKEQIETIEEQRKGQIETIEEQRKEQENLIVSIRTQNRYLEGIHKQDGFSWEEIVAGENKQQVELFCRRKGQTLWVSVVDHGIGIADIEEARQPFFTTKPEKERSGMGFVFMETFMDEIQIDSKVGKGTRVTMRKTIGERADEKKTAEESGE